MRPRARRSGLRRGGPLGALALAITAGAGGILLGACTSPRNALGPSESPCFRVLARASAAVHHEGRYAGVRYLSVAELARALERSRPQLVDVPPAVTKSREGVCVVAYTGSFTSQYVEAGWSVDSPHGRYAVVVVSVTGERVIATIVLQHAPVRFTRLFPVVR
ncbi:MAG TPA: hypothetical protein VMU75_05730 [Acidimicrobiales bacterium]|nr:hypothetical protein [Acidimicrobiales bacterium]